MTKQDSVFLKHFVQLILGLMAFAVVLMFVAHALHDRFYGESAAAAGVQVAYGCTLDGSVIYQNLCSACHNSGAGGAPMLTKEVWAPRIAQGMDLLIKHATEGYQGAAGIMPAKGGNPALTDEQVKATVEFMVGKVQ